MERESASAVRLHFQCFATLASDLANRNDIDSNASDAKSNLRVLHRVGRMGPGRNGLIHLRVGPGAGHARPFAAIWNSGYDGEYRLLRWNVICIVLSRMGHGLALGTGRRPLWARLHVDAHD